MTANRLCLLKSAWTIVCNCTMLQCCNLFVQCDTFAVSLSPTASAFWYQLSLLLPGVTCGYFLVLLSHGSLGLSMHFANPGSEFICVTMHAGGDWGGSLSKSLGLFHSSHCKGIHLNFTRALPQPYNPLHILQSINALTPILDRLPILLSSKEIQDLKDSKHWDDHEAGEQCMQSQSY